MSKIHCPECGYLFKKSTLDRNDGICKKCYNRNNPSSKKGVIPKRLREKLWLRDCKNRFWGKCFCCEMKLSSIEFAAGHIQSEAMGGKIVLENLKVVCKSCNSKMGTQNLYEFQCERYPCVYRKSLFILTNDDLIDTIIHNKAKEIFLEHKNVTTKNCIIL